ncbi:hypothetical protein [Pseudobacteriovorax antillogorgiicola]|uniref:C-type lectin domain-containing protein n=1 Tax=Pseudobacteriovorax antillogorgiicola TaxID=1513793 RepID=A0A1Y6CIK6_9BACT|nr:hypothetical protein [Pseudobacteriovorax antillogorgiicola]TCS46985.1 hypothetical protein EDD56_12280 [Pseudobacteriovorax antillogorgiicola]SMF64842.1 hypothetical protein SAMN06296036_12280 [Pseudobacteriovorax antillogorgiicola]
MQLSKTFVTLGLFIFTCACGPSKFKAVTDEKMESSDLIVAQTTEPEAKVSQVAHPDHQDVSNQPEVNSPEIARTETKKSLLGQTVWVQSWNTDEYQTSECLQLTQGIAVTERDCQETLPVVCESICQADATSPEDCDQEVFVFQEKKDSLTYEEAAQYCESQGMVVLKYHHSKIETFRSAQN